MPEDRVIVWVQHRGDRPYLSLEWHDPTTGKRRSKSAETCNPLEAERARADLEYELNNGLHKQAASMSWARLRELFEEEYAAARRENTRQNYEAALDWFERVCGQPALRTLNERTVSAFAAGLRKEGMAPSTVKVRLQFLRTVLGWAAEQKLIPRVPKFPTVRVPRKRPQPVPVESFERLLEKAPDQQTRAFLLTGWLAGLRLSEALALEWEPTDDAPYLDPARSRIVLPAERVKGVEDQWVPLDPELWEVLQALPRHGRKVFHFTDRRGGILEGKPIGETAVSDRIIRLAKRAGVKLTMRSLRRGFGCRYAGKVPAQVLQRLMRHANIKTTMDYYANVDEAAMEAVLGGRRVTGRVTGREGAGAPGEAPAATPCHQSPESEQTPPPPPAGA